MTLTNEYTLPIELDPDKVRSLAKSYDWLGKIEVDDSHIISERPMPPALFQLLTKISEVKTPSLSLYQECKEVYNEVLNDGERTFPRVYDVLLQYGFAANCVLAMMINMEEASNHLGRKTAKKLLNLTMGMNIQPRLFD